MMSAMLSFLLATSACCVLDWQMLSFWIEDRSVPFSDFLPRLNNIAFYERLGTMYDKALATGKTGG